jgi:hypothetical protein
MGFDLGLKIDSLASRHCCGYFNSSNLGPFLIVA